MFEYCKVRVSLKLEIIEGDDEGYREEFNNKVLELTRDLSVGDKFVEPYYLKVALMTPALERQQRRREVERYERYKAEETTGEEANENV